MLTPAALARSVYGPMTLVPYGSRAQAMSPFILSALGARQGPFHSFSALWLALRRTMTVGPIQSDVLFLLTIFSFGCSVLRVGLWLLPRWGNESDQIPLQKCGLQCRQVLYHA